MTTLMPLPELLAALRDRYSVGYVEQKDGKPRFHRRWRHLLRHEEALALLTEQIAAHRREERERCIAACQAAKLEPDCMLYGTGLGAVHDGACGDCIDAIREIFPTTEPENGQGQ